MKINVCKVMFLSTLGYSMKNDKIVTSAFRGNIIADTVPIDGRGRHPPKHKITLDDDNTITAHIMSFNPAISHYRREHAPRRLYLPPEISVKEMHKDYEKKCTVGGRKFYCYEQYRKNVRDLNISFAKLGSEECKTCDAHRLHVISGNKEVTESKDMKKETRAMQTCCGNDECDTCKTYKAHWLKVITAREAYSIDRKESESNPEKDTKDTIILFVDMHKVVLLPRLPGYKVSMFTRRLVAINETFAPLGKSKIRPIGVLWHEELCGRNDEDVSSSYAKIFQVATLRDFKHFIFWADNCSGQNKCWTLFTMFANIVNTAGGADKVTMKYLVAGHTFMSADSFHHKVEKKMNSIKNVCFYRLRYLCELLWGGHSNEHRRFQIMGKWSQPG